MIKQIKKLFEAFTLFLILVGINFPQVNNPESIIIVRDGIKLQGKVFSTEGTGPFTTVILLHGFPGNEKDVLGLGKRFSEAGINALTFNYSGTFGSEGLYSFVNSQKDIKAAYDFLHKKSNVEKYKIDTAKIILGGYSYGGGMALTYAANHPEIKKIFSVAGTDHGEFMREYASDSDFVKMIDPIFEELKAPQGPVRFDIGSTPVEILQTGL